MKILGVGVENPSSAFIQNNKTYFKATEIKTDIYSEIYSISTEENRGFRNKNKYII